MLVPAALGAIWLAFRVSALDNGLARTPQMGWNNWNAFGCDVSEDLILQTATRIVELGLRDAGYTYTNMDDCYQDGRTANGTLRADATKFPNGINHLSNHIHSLGMKFGMYSSAGTLTCGGYTGSLGYEESDAQTFADWGVDLLKYDNCYNEGQSGTPLITYNRYKKMSDALNATGRPILYSMCNWGEDYPWKWAQTVANSWRMSGDIHDSFDRPDVRCPCSGNEGYDCALPGFHCSAMNILNKMASYPDKAIPGAWNDLDMLEVGNGGMTDAEYVTHFTMWAAVKSPLIMGNDIRTITPQTLSILTNPAIIAINQDPAGTSVVRRWRTYVSDNNNNSSSNSSSNPSSPAELHLWSGSLANGDHLAILLNGGGAARTMHATLADIFVDDGGARSDAAAHAWDLHDLWANRMGAATAAAIIAGNVTAIPASAPYWNATATSYADGLARNASVLFGTRVGSVAPGGTIEARVEGHGVRAFRLRMRDADAE